MKFELHYKDEAVYSVDAESKEQAIARADEFWAARVPQVTVRQMEAPQHVSGRLESIRGYKENEQTLKRIADEQTQAKADNLVARIRALKPRIEALLETGNACLENGIEINVYGRGHYPDQDKYEKGTFVTNGISHKVGFVQPYTPYGRKPAPITEMGIENGGACGPYDFRTNGEAVYFIHEKDASDIKVPSYKLRDLEEFLRDFDKFESAFYGYVDKVIEKQQKSVDRLIASAQSRAESNHNPQHSAPQHAVPGAER